MKYITISTIWLLLASCGGNKISLPVAPEKITANCDPTIVDFTSYAVVTNPKCSIKVTHKNDEMMANYSLETNIEVEILKVKEDQKTSYFELALYNKDNKAVCTFLMMRATDLADFNKKLSSGNGIVSLTFNGEMPILALLSKEEAENEAKKFVEELKTVARVEVKCILVKTTSSSEEVEGCPEFEEYKDAVEEYVDLLQEIKDDPANMSNAARVTQVAQEVSAKAQKLINCANYGDLQGQISELNQKINSLR